MRSLILLSVLFCSQVYAIPVSDLDVQWEQFKVKFERNFATLEEEASRKAIFAKKLEFIESHNNKFADGVVTHEVDVNQFSDWTDEEFNSFLSPMPVLNRTLYNIEVVPEPDPKLVAAAPTSYDWRSEGKVSPIKNQGQCGGCWAFAAVASIESAYLVHKSEKVILSEQNLLDCDTKSGSCNGGYVNTALAYAASTGLENESVYPYVAKKESCLNKATETHTKISGSKALSHPATEDAIVNAVYSEGPVTIGIDASGSDFSSYKSGIISSGGKNLNHAVMIVGYAPTYWIVKNSWGTSWGESGFFQLARGNNVRGVNQDVMYPVL